MPKVSDDHLAARRNQILIAAYRCFGSQGFHRTTMRDICREAGLSAGAVYNYFKGKEEIVEALAACGREGTRAVIDSIELPEQAPRALAEIMRSLLTTLDTPEGAESSRLDLRLWGEAVHSERIQELFVKALDTLLEPLVEVVRAGQERGEIDLEIEADAVALLTVATLLGMQVLRAVDPDRRVAGGARAFDSLVAGRFSRGGGAA